MNIVITGKVVRGNGIGRGFSYPTANIVISADAQPADGVYAGRATAEGKIYDAMVYVGRRPTVVNDGERLLEAHLFGFADDLYGKTISVELLHFVRPGRKFSSREELIENINSDKEQILKYFNIHKCTI